MRYLPVLTLALSACTGLAPIGSSDPVKLSPSQVAQIRSAVTRDFFDPASAQFRNIRAADVSLEDGRSMRRVCGEVNGKNRMGGYVGYSLFGGVIEGGRFRREDFFGLCE